MRNCNSPTVHRQRLDLSLPMRAVAKAGSSVAYAQVVRLHHPGPADDPEEDVRPVLIY
jgi:hypothetical protein